MAQHEIQSSTIIQTMSLYELSYDGDTVVDTSGKPFDAMEYSKFKYGDSAAICSYAEMIAHELIASYGGMIDNSFVAGSAYKHVPTAAHAISTSLISELTMQGCTPAGAFHVDRAVVHASDYSALSDSERAVVSSQNGLVLPEAAAQELSENSVLVVDDIKVTGRHEAALIDVLKTIGAKTVLFAYIATVQPEVAITKPHIEHEINHAYVKGLDQISAIAATPDFILNARTCKFILQSSGADIRQFVEAIPETRARNMLSSMVADGYHLMEQYKDNFWSFSNALMLRRQAESTTKQTA